MRLSRLVPALVLGLSLAACGGGGGGGPAGGTGNPVVGGGSATLRLVAVNRQALSPSASPRLQLFVERPAGADPRAFVLEESLDGVHFSALALPPVAVLAGTIQWEPPAISGPAGFGTRFYRVSAPLPSNRVAADFGVPALPPTMTFPAAGAQGISTTPQLSVVGGSRARTYLYAVSDAEGTLVWLAESDSVSLAPGVAAVPGVTTFIAPPGAAGELAAGAGHVATVVGIDAEGYGAAGAPRVEFFTR